MDDEDEIEDETKDIMEDYGVDESDAGEILELRDELGVDEDEAHEIWEAL